VIKCRTYIRSILQDLGNHEIKTTMLELKRRGKKSILEFIYYRETTKPKRGLICLRHVSRVGQGGDLPNRAYLFRSSYHIHHPTLITSPYISTSFPVVELHHQLLGSP